MCSLNCVQLRYSTILVTFPRIISTISTFTLQHWIYATIFHAQHIHRMLCKLLSDRRIKQVDSDAKLASGGELSWVSFSQEEGKVSEKSKGKFCGWNVWGLFYLGSELQQVADIESRRRLRSASSPWPHVPRSLHKTIGDRAYPIATAKVWNTLPPAITSLEAFKRALKTELFRRSYGNTHHRQQ